MECWLIVGGIFLFTIVCISIPLMVEVPNLIEKDERYKELNTISEAEGCAIRELMKQYKWKTMYSPTYCELPIGGCINVNTEGIATRLATKHATEFAAIHGYDANLIYKLFYIYNKANGELCIGDTTYVTISEPAKRGVLTGHITEGYTYRHAKNTEYCVKYFILESVA